MSRPGYLLRSALALALASATAGLTASAASAWSPAVTVSRAATAANVPAVGVADDMRSVHLWESASFASSLVQVRGRAADGTWDSVENVATGDQPALATNSAGTAAIAWRKPSAFGDKVQLSVRAADGTLSDTLDVSTPGAGSDLPAVGIAGNGAVTLVWREQGAIMLRHRAADGTLGAARQVSTRPGVSEPEVRVSSSGNAAAVWRHTDGVNTGVEAVAIASDGTPTASVSPAIAGTSQSAHVGVSDSGDALVVWARPYHTTDRVQLRTLAADGTLGALKLISPATSAASQPNVAVNPAGDAIIVWRSLDGGDQRIRAVRRSAAGVVGTKQTLSSTGADGRDPVADLAASGRALVAWDRPGTTTNVQARSLFGDGSKGPVMAVGTSSTTDATQPAVDVNESGGSVIGWLRNDGAATRVRASFGEPSLRTSTGALAYTENDTKPVDDGITVVDDSERLTGAMVWINGNHLAGEDELAFTDQNGITGTYDDNSGQLLLAGDASPADYQAALRSVTYTNHSEAPQSATRTVRIQVADGISNSDPVVRTIDITAVADAPVVTTPGSPQLFTAGGSAVSVDGGVTVTDLDSADLQGATATITGGYLAGDRINFTDQNGITGAYDAASHALTLTGTASLDDYETALRSLTFDSTSGTPGSATRTVTFKVTDAEGTDSATATQDVDVDPGNTPPTAHDVSFNAIANTALMISPQGTSVPGMVTGAGSLLDSVTDPDGSSGLGITSGTANTTGGGTVMLGNDGTFIYQSKAGETAATDTFTYQATDGAGADSTGTVTINLRGRIWWVNDGNSGDGTANNPVGSVGAATAAAGPGDTIYVSRGLGVTSAGVTLAAGQQLVGSGAALTVDLGSSGFPSGTQTLLAADSKPTLTSAAGTRVVTLGSGGSVRGVKIDAPTGGGGIYAGAGVNGGTIAGVDVADTAPVGNKPGIELNGSSGTFAISDVTVSTTGTEALKASNGGTVTVTGSANTLASTNAAALNVANTTIGAAGLTFRSIGSANAANGILLDHTGTAGGLTVTGTGAAGTGGSITSTTGADGAVAGNGVYLNTTKNVSLRAMTISNHPNYAIRGLAVDGFELKDSTVAGTNGTLSGNGASEQEAAVAFDGLTGSAAFTGDTISGGRTENVRIVNSSGTLSTLTFSGNTVQDNVGDANKLGDGVQVQATGSAVIGDATIANNTVRRVMGYSIHVQALGSAQVTTSITGNTVRGGHASAALGGIVVDSSRQEDIPAGSSPAFNGTMHYTVGSNDIQGVTAGSAMTVSKGFGNSTFNGSVTNNVVGNPAVDGSGATQSLGLFWQAYGSGNAVTSITGNQIRQVAQVGIQVSAGVGPVNADATVTGNSVTNPSSAATFTNAFNLNTGISSSYSAPTVCLDLSGNTFAGIGQGGQADMRIRQRFDSVVRLRGFTGTGSDTNAVNAWATGANTGTSSSSVGTLGFANTAGGGACRQP